MNPFTKGHSGPHYTRPLLPFVSFLLAALVGVVSALTFSAVYDMTSKFLTGERNEMAGVWQGEWENVPAVTMHLVQNGNVVTGSVKFVAILKGPRGLETVHPTGNLSIVNPRFDGEKLCFELQDWRDGSAAEMEMLLIGDGEALLRRTDGLPEVSPAVRMKRERSF